MVPKQFTFSRNKNKTNLWLQALHFRLKKCENILLYIVFFEVKLCFSFIYSKILTQFKITFHSLLTSKTGLTVKYANKTCLYSKNSEITFSDLTFWRRGFKLLEAGRSCSSDATNLGQKPKMASFGRLWQPVNTIGECEMS